MSEHPRLAVMEVLASGRFNVVEYGLVHNENGSDDVPVALATDLATRGEADAWIAGYRFADEEGDSRVSWMR